MPSPHPLPVYFSTAQRLFTLLLTHRFTVLVPLLFTALCLTKSQAVAQSPALPFHETPREVPLSNSVFSSDSDETTHTQPSEITEEIQFSDPVQKEEAEIQFSDPVQKEEAEETGEAEELSKGRSTGQVLQGSPPEENFNSVNDRSIDPSASSATYTSQVLARRPPPPGTRTTLNRRELDFRGASNLPEALESEVAIDVQEGPKNGSILQIRGFDERAVLVLFEGIPLRENYDGHFNIAALPTAMVGNIDAERGLTSLLYGPNSGGGIVSLTADNLRPDGAEVRLFVGNPRKGSFHRYGTTGSAKKSVGPFSLFLSGSYDHSDGYILSNNYKPTIQNAPFHENGGMRDGSEFRRLSATLLATYTPERNKRVSLFFNYINSPRGIPTFEGSGVTRFWKMKRYDTFLVALSTTLGPIIPPSQWGFREAKVQLYTHQHLDELNDYQDATYTSLTTNPHAWFVASSYDNATYGVSGQATFALNTGNKLTFSARYQFDESNQCEIPVGKSYRQESWSRPDEFSSHNFGGAIEDSQVIGPWRFLLGVAVNGLKLRSQIYGGKAFETEQRTLPAAEGRLVAERNLIQGLVLVAGVGRKVRFPTLKELYSNTVGRNTKLQAEYAWMAELGLDVDLQKIGFIGTLRGFYNDIQDMIEMRYDLYTNIGKARTAGVELEATWTPISFLKVMGSYRYLYAKDVNRNQELDYRTPHKFRLSLRYLAPFGLTADLTGIYHATQYAYYTEIHQTARDVVDGFFLLNTSLRYDLTIGGRNRGIYVYATGRNLLDINYSVGSYEPRAGREILFGIGGKI